ncbi:MAG: hypothetical protein ABI231_03275 [Candidatus Tumulicola sp.]
MTQRKGILAAGLAVACALVLAACNASTSATTPATPTPALTNVAGQYNGSVQDSVFGNGRALGDFSQTGSAVGGRLQYAYGTQTILNSVAMSLSRSNALGGTATATIGSAACTFGISSTYDATTFKLSGNYSATNGCSGESGTFALKEACYYKQGAAPRSQEAPLRRHAADRPNASGLHPC